MDGEQYKMHVSQSKGLIFLSRLQRRVKEFYFSVLGFICPVNLWYFITIILFSVLEILSFLKSQIGFVVKRNGNIGILTGKGYTNFRRVLLHKR